MKKLSVSTCLLLTSFIGGSVLRAQNAPSATRVAHVLVISIDGMHSQDLAKWVSASPSSTLAQLMATGVNYPNAFTTQPSDSIPSTVGIFTGASPSLGGMYYDDAWQRVWAPSFSSGKACNAGVPNGTAIDLKQGIDFNGNSLDAGGGIKPDNLPRDPFNNCAPVYPHDMLRVNTIFEVVKAAGMYTAYSEKRPSYDFLNGPSGVGVQDLYTPEINFYNLLVPAQIEAFDDLRVTSVINEINELNHDGTAAAPLPALFGMNFQAVNSAKKASTTSGYADSSGTPDGILLGALSYVDTSIGKMLAAFPSGQLKKTAVVITAKHGESPLSNTRTIVLTSAISNVLNAALNSAGTVGIKFNKITQKTSALIWLADPADTDAAVFALNNASAIDPVFAAVFAANLSQVLSFGNGLPFPQPGTAPATDPAPPDIVVVMNNSNSVNFEPSLTSTTYAEHGGFGENETHVPLLISNPGWTGFSLSCTVATRQIAPTVLTLLGLDPNALQAVQIEGTAVLPFTQTCQ